MLTPETCKSSTPLRAKTAEKPAKPQAMQAIEPISLDAETCSTTCKSPMMGAAGFVEPL